MKDGRYVFRNCIPDGSLDIANIQPGELMQREMSFRVNKVPEIQKALDAGTFDPRNILQGKDGELYDEDGNFLAQVNTFQAQMEFNTEDYQAAGQNVVWGVNTGYTFTLTFTETVVNDRLLQKILGAIKNGRKAPQLNFTGVLRAA